MWKYLIYCLLFFGANQLLGQVVIQPKQIGQERKGILYEKEWNIDIRLLTNGVFGFGFDWGSIEAYNRSNFYSVSMDLHRHPKEYRQNPGPRLYNNITRSFVYGKQNSFLSLKGGIGRKMYFSEKSKRKGVAVGFTYQGGLSFGVLKPYYVEVRDPADARNIIAIKYSEETAERFLDRNVIEGGASFFKGLGESKIIPGLYGKAGIKFDWGAYDEFVKSFDMGIMLELYTREISMMLNSKNNPYLLNAYISIQFGRRK